MNGDDELKIACEYRASHQSNARTDRRANRTFRAGNDPTKGYHMTTAHPASPIISAAEAFALTLETACEDFENLLDLIDGDIKVVTSPRDAAMSNHKVHRLARAPLRIQMALAKSFVFNARGANRICQKNSAALALDRLERNRFMKATDHLAVLRDVNEHGFDGGKDDVKPSMRFHPEGGWMDETALVASSREKILMGAINLYPVYLAVDRMRTLAGFNARLPRSTPSSTP
jgi:hypothetical protein